MKNHMNINYELPEIQAAIAKAERMAERDDQPYCVLFRPPCTTFTIPDDGDTIHGTTMIYSTADGRLF